MWESNRYSKPKVEQYEKSTATIVAVFSVVGAEGVEPPTLCL